MFNGSRTLIYAYGTLKQRFPNHFLLEDLITQNDAVYIGTYKTLHQLPLVIGPFGIPYLLNIPETGHQIIGELYSVTPQGLARLDELEGTRIGHYERLPIRIFEEKGGGGCGGGETTVDAEAYYAHRSYAADLLNKSGGADGTRMEYTADEAKGYVTKESRSGDGNILDEIRLFISGHSH